MKFILEEEVETTDEISKEVTKNIIKVKDVKDKAEALTMKDTKKKQFMHICRHEEGLPCTREAL